MFNENTKSVIKHHNSQVIKNISIIGDDKIFVDFLDFDNMIIRDDGQQCCEARYITTDDDLMAFVGARFIGIRLLSAPNGKAPDSDLRTDDDGPVYHEVQFLIIDTTYGCIVFETHNEHNGYYGGFDIVAENTEIKYGFNIGDKVIIHDVLWGYVPKIYLSEWISQQRKDWKNIPDVEKVFIVKSKPDIDNCMLISDNENTWNIDAMFLTLFSS
jgi:hypothetical protein